jgi:hypothetical protein
LKEYLHGILELRADKYFPVISQKVQSIKKTSLKKHPTK